MGGPAQGEPGDQGPRVEAADLDHAIGGGEGDLAIDRVEIPDDGPRAGRQGEDGPSTGDLVDAEFGPGHVPVSGREPGGEEESVGAEPEDGGGLARVRQQEQLAIVGDPTDADVPLRVAVGEPLEPGVEGGAHRRGVGPLATRDEAEVDQSHRGDGLVAQGRRRGDSSSLGQRIQRVEPSPGPVGAPDRTRLGQVRSPQLGAEPQRRERRADGDDHQQRRHGGGHGREGGLAPAPSPGVPQRADATGRDRPIGEKPPQVLCHRRGGVIPPGGLLPQARQADRLQVARDLRLPPRRRQRVLGRHLHQGLQRRPGMEGRPARDQFVEDRPQGIDVGRRADPPGLAPGLLGGHVTGRPHQGSAPGPARLVVEPLGQAEVGDLGDAVGGQEDVRGLQVAVDDPPAVGGVDRVGQGLHQPGRRSDRHRRAGILLGQGAPLDQFQDQVGAAVMLADLEDLDDVGVLEARHGLRLGAEAGPDLGPGELPLADHLEGDRAVEPDLPRLVDDAHPAPAQLAEDLMPVDFRPDRWAPERPGRVAPRVIRRRVGRVASRAVDKRPHRPMQRDLPAQVVGEPREPRQVLLRRR